MRRLSDWLQENQTAVAIFGPIGAALSALGVRTAPNALWVAVFVVLLAACVAAPAVASRVNRLQQGGRAAEECIRRLLNACGHSFGYPGKHVRANIMKFSPDGHRRRVDHSTAFNMDADADRDFEIDAHAGVSGQAALHRRPAFGDILMPLQPGGPDWGLLDAEKAKVRPSLKSILSVPVFDPADPSGRLLATLQVDSDLSLEEVGFDEQEKWEMAQRFADVVSLRLETGR
jgi:hypothetical protein